MLSNPSLVVVIVGFRITGRVPGSHLAGQVCEKNSLVFNEKYLLHCLFDISLGA